MVRYRKSYGSPANRPGARENFAESRYLTLKVGKSVKVWTMKPIEKQIMKLYASEAEAVAHEGNIKGIDGCVYDSLEQAQSYFPEGRVFAFIEGKGLRVAWTTS
jgi:hypothetical protein